MGFPKNPLIHFRGRLLFFHFEEKNVFWKVVTPYSFFATNGTHLLVLSMLDVLTCLEVSTGSIIWQLDFKAREGIGVPSFGGVSSTLIGVTSMLSWQLDLRM
mgnify:CR=1 FL=1|tara:strand:- start:1088 stop:1393 length:306 start_codon:yes stop_codon:yes gene_type:complete